MDVRRTVEYSCTAMSCSPASALFARPERYLYSCVKAWSSCLLGLDEESKAVEIRLDRMEEVRSGIGSSGFDDCLRSGRNGE